MDLRAIVVNCKDCCSHSVETRRITMRLLNITIKGVTTMDNTIAASIGFSSTGGMRALSPANASNTKPNSPACPRYRPVRRATPIGAPRPRESAVINPTLSNGGMRTSTSTKPQFCKTRRQSNNMPMLIKNRPNSTSW